MSWRLSDLRSEVLGVSGLIESLLRSSAGTLVARLGLAGAFLAKRESVGELGQRFSPAVRESVWFSAPHS